MVHYNRRMRRASGSGRKNEINMIPFLDVLLTLLIVFMVATPVVNRSVDVSVPDSAIGKTTSDIDSKTIIVVEVHHDASYTLYFNTEKYTNLTEQQLINQLNSIITNGGEDGGKLEFDNMIVQVAADKTVQYQTVVSALSMLKKYGFNDVGLITSGAADIPVEAPSSAPAP